MKLSTQILQDLESLKNPAQAAHSQRFFKTGPGEYAEGDLFWGLTTPQIKVIVKKYARQASLADVSDLLANAYHDARCVGFLILVSRFEKGTELEQAEIYTFYMSRLKRANNWDLVDISCYKIAGAYLYGKDTSILYELAKSDNLWEQRVSIVSTMYFVKRGEFKVTLDLAEHFLTHKHDLIRKAAGWLLREVGKKDERALTDFLDKFHHKMPRTMLRYSLEKLTLVQKAYYMKKD